MTGGAFNRPVTVKLLSNSSLQPRDYGEILRFSCKYEEKGRADERTRTADLLITSELLNINVQAHLSITRKLTSDRSEPLANCE